ncbi:MAG: biotin--[acetyl-CoA-carboxylase] ligase [Candidatus Bipolaricaulota bacterium]
MEDGRVGSALEPMMPTVDPNKSLRFSTTKLAEVDSTNAYALRCAEDLPHGAVIVADRQTAGRGRAGRRWHSPQGNLYMTVLLKEFPAGVKQWGLGWLTLAMAVAVARVLETRGLAPRIKWPNDVLLEGRKVAGVLAETRWHQGQPTVLALGIGVNLNMPPEEAAKLEVPAAVVAQVLGRSDDRDAFAEEVLVAFFAALGGVDDAGPQRLKRDVLQRSWFLGRSVLVKRAAGSLSGRAVGLDDQGALLVADESETVHTVLTGDVTCW